MNTQDQIKQFTDRLAILLIGPSGVGKGRITRYLMKEDPNLRLSISITTRNPREDEEHGREYYFDDDEGFNSKKEKGLFLEHIQSRFGKYGTLREEVLKYFKDGHDVIFDVDPEGALKLISILPNSCSFFLLPPSVEELRLRIEMRGSERGINGQKDLEARLKTIWEYIEFANNFDYVFINDKSKITAPEIYKVIKCKKLAMNSASILKNWVEEEHRDMLTLAQKILS